MLEKVDRYLHLVRELDLKLVKAVDTHLHADHITGLGAERFRIRSVDVGGAFGIRNEVYPEFLALMLAAKKTGRAVKWTGTRAETMSGDHHGRADAGGPSGRHGAHGEDDERLRRQRLGHL